MNHFNIRLMFLEIVKANQENPALPYHFHDALQDLGELIEPYVVNRLNHGNGIPFEKRMERLDVRDNPRTSLIRKFVGIPDSLLRDIHATVLAHPAILSQPAD
ncbi:MAG: hypothetical protein ABR880_22880 [Candidatus Sulfotelmatobacter sp.]